MTKELIGAIAIGIVALIALIIWRNNRRVRASQELLIENPKDFTGKGEYKAFYVATVFADQPLVRVWAHGLGPRGQCSLALSQNELGISRRGEISFSIPLTTGTTTSSLSATIDKGVERSGLTAINWKLGDIELQTVVRIVATDVRKDFENRLHSAIGAAIG